MRTTTLTLDDDVAALLDRARAEQGSGVERLVNKALRSALSALAPGDRGRPTAAASQEAERQPATFQTLVELVSRHADSDKELADDLEAIQRDQPRLDEDPWDS